MLSSISIDNFRCFEKFDLDTLERVNLIAGKNNVGKTTLLEALSLLGNGVDIRRFMNIQDNLVRHLNLEPTGDLVFMPIFRNFDTKNTVKISSCLKNGQEFKVEISITKSENLVLNSDDNKTFNKLPNYSTGQLLEFIWTNPEEKNYKLQIFETGNGLQVNGQVYPAKEPLSVLMIVSKKTQAPEDNAERFGRLELTKQPSKILESLKIVEPRLENITTIYISGKPLIYGDIGLDKMLPLSFMGEGLDRLTSLLLAIADTPNGIVLIDEIENGFHHSVMTKVWQAIGDAARRFDTQVIATTHSYECIRAAHQAFAETESDDFRLHRLDRIGDKIKAVTYDSETLETALKAELEVR